jgi:hypothetical protein
MAQAGFTPISLYYSTTASAIPTSGNLANGELGLNIADMKLYAKNSAGTVTLLASSNSTGATVSSVAVSGGTTGLTTSGGPITSSGTITLAGTLAITNGGTGQTTASAAFNALSPITTTGDLIIGNGTNSATRLAIGTNGYILTSNGTTATWAAAPAGGVTTFSAGTTGLTPNTATSGAITLAGTLALANGGTGQTSANAAFNALAPSQTSNSGKYLTTNGTNTSWATVTAGVSKGQAIVLSMIFG